MKTSSGIQDYLRRSRSPATYGIIGAALAVYVLSWFMGGKLFEPLSFATDWSRPWGILTYPFASVGAGTGLFWFLLELYWLFWVGSVTENDIGTAKFLGFFAALMVLAGLSIWLGMLVVRPGHAGALGGLELPIAGLTVAWGTRHKNESVLLMFVIPVQGWMLALLTTALVLFGFGSMLNAPLLGAFACVHLLLAYYFAANRLPGLAYRKSESRVSTAQLKATEKKDKSYYEDVKRREQEREERERLRKLFEDSMKDE